uniref:Ionotropic glutamate receptor L-glutamate and glycine-binding domain-containing protein n=1 Tax=Stomoxys calcitrans TaxID=35570 RepID=A0A1I8NX71_STOCA
MKDLLKLVIGLFVTAFFTLLLVLDVVLCENSEWKYPTNLADLLLDIYNERPFVSMLLIKPTTIAEVPWDLKTIFQWEIPKIIMKPGQEFELRKVFNKEVIAVVFMPSNFDAVLFDTCAQLFNDTRQTRIVVATEDLKTSQTLFEEELLQASESYKMTRIMLSYLNSKGGELSSYLRLQPYPNYQWRNPTNNGYFYPEYWRNLHRKKVVVFAEQSIPRVFLFKDPVGNIQYSGYLAKLVELFVQCYNGTMQPYQPPVLDKYSFYSDIKELMEQQLIDIPMTLKSGIDDGVDEKLHRKSDCIEVTQIKLMVPCRSPRSIPELYHLLLDLDFIGSLTIGTIIFSSTHSLFDWIFGEMVQPWSFLLNDKGLPSLLGQAFAARVSPRASLKILYLIMFFAGLYTNMRFGAKMKTLFTTPPYHRHIENFEELNRSPVTILVPENAYEEPPYPIEKLMITKDSNLFQEMRQSLNTSYGYFTSLSTWQMFKQMQRAIFDKIFCIFDNLTITSPRTMAFRLQRNSLFKETLDVLIHRVHDAGLMQAWYSQTFADLLKQKEIQFIYNTDLPGALALNVGDLCWLWITLAVSLLIDFLVFFVEILIHRYV